MSENVLPPRSTSLSHYILDPEMDSLTSDDKEELFIIQKEENASEERFGFQMFRLLGLVLAGIGVAQQVFSANPYSISTTGGTLLFSGVLLFGGAIYFSKRQSLTAKELEFLREREENQLFWETASVPQHEDIEAKSKYSAHPDLPQENDLNEKD